MAEQVKGYLLGPGLASKIRQTIATVDGTPVGSGVSKIPIDLSGDPAPPVKAFRIATFTGTWSLGSDKAVTLKNVAATPNTVSAKNLFFDITANGTADCAIAKDGTVWYLVQDVHTTVEVVTNVTLGTAGLQFTKTLLTVVRTATANPTNIGTTACS